MELLQIQYFCTVARLNHMTRAAEELHLSQPTLTASIQRLEKELGVRLFDRSGRNIYLNEYGREFYRHAQAALSELSIAVHSIDQMKSSAENAVTLIAPSLHASHGLFDLLLSCCPYISITDLGDNPVMMREMLLSGKADLAISMAPVNDSDLASDILREEQFIILTSTNGFFAGRDAVYPDEMGEVWFASHKKDHGPRLIFDQIFSGRTVVPKVRYEGNSLADNINAVRSGRYVALITMRTAKRILPLNPDLRCVELLDVNCCFTRRLLYRSGKMLRPMAARVRQVILDFYREPESVRPYR